MQFFTLFRKKIITNWFSWIIFFYLICGSTWFYGRLPNDDVTQEEQTSLAETSFKTKETISEPVVSDHSASLKKFDDEKKNDEYFVGTVQVTSGKTFKLVTPVSDAWRKRVVRRIQLYGVDTCETRQTAKRNDQEWPCGAVATAWLVTKTLDREVICRPSIVRTGVLFAQCFVDGIDIAEIGLSDGILLISKDKENSPPSQYLSLEQVAKEKKLGLWSSAFVDPVQWRRNNGTYNPFDPR